MLPCQHRIAFDDLLCAKMDMFPQTDKTAKIRRYILFPDWTNERVQTFYARDIFHWLTAQKELIYICMYIILINMSISLSAAGFVAKGKQEHL